MSSLLTRRYPVWLAALVGFVVLFGLFYATNTDARNAGEATGYAFVPGIFGAGVIAVLSGRHNRRVDRRNKKARAQRDGKDKGVRPWLQS
jgi:peptidoglycan/LPS O-acetylase OafA/YrhL